MDEMKKKPLDILTKFGGSLLSNGRNGIRYNGWTVESRQGPILKSAQATMWEKELGAFRLPEMVFGESRLELMHEASGLKIHFNAWDALHGWTKEKLPPVLIPASVKWMERNKTNKEVVLDYDYTFTTTYCGSAEVVTDERVTNTGTQEAVAVPYREGSKAEDSPGKFEWAQSTESIDWPLLQERDPILFYDEVVLYEDELADCGIALCTAKVRVMPKCWFVLLRFWMRVDGVMIRLRDTRIFCAFAEGSNKPNIVRERCNVEILLDDLAKKGVPMESIFYADPSMIVDGLNDLDRKIEKLYF